MKKFIENIIESKSAEYEKRYSMSYRFKKIFDEIKTLDISEDKILEILKVIRKYEN